MELKYFKLFTQEEVVAPAKVTEDGWYVENPAIMVHLENYKIVLANWLPYTKIDTGGLIPHDTIALVLDVADDMVEYYTKWLNPDQVNTIHVNDMGEVQANK